MEVNAALQAVEKLVWNLENFSEMLGGVEGIRRERGGIARWTIATETPVGHVRFSFPVRETSPHAEVIEWSPAPNERENLLRYSLKLKESNKTTVVDVTHQVELRRQRAWELHPG